MTAYNVVPSQSVYDQTIYEMFCVFVLTIYEKVKISFVITSVHSWVLVHTQVKHFQIIHFTVYVCFIFDL